MSALSWLTRVAVVAAMAGTLSVGGAPAVAADRHTLVPLVDLAAQRVLVGDKVAAAKFGTDQPIDDPAREQQILDSVAASSVELGIDPAATVRFFRAQIEANKQVQRGLYALWTEHPELRPTERPDLITEVRPELDRITTAVLAELQATVWIRDATAACWSQVVLAKVRSVIQYRLDTLHRHALATALVPVCS